MNKRKTNPRCNHIEVDYKGVHYKSYKELWHKLNVSFSYKIFMQRINRGLSIEEAIKKEYVPIKERNVVNETSLIEYHGEKYISYHKLWESQETNISYSRFMARIQQGYSIEDSLVPSGTYVNKSIVFNEKIYQTLHDLWEDIPNNERYNSFTSKLRKGLPILVALNIIPNISYSNYRMTKHDFYFRENFYIGNKLYTGIDNHIYVKCCINNCDCILSIDEIYQRMEEIVLEEYKTTGTVQTTKS